MLMKKNGKWVGGGGAELNKSRRASLGHRGFKGGSLFTTPISCGRLSSQTNLLFSGRGEQC